MNYYDTNINLVQTDHDLTLRGIPNDVALYRYAGIYPMRYDYLTFDAATQKQVVSGVPHPEYVDGAVSVYVQDFEIVQLTAEELKQKQEMEAAMAKFDAEHAATPVS